MTTLSATCQSSSKFTGGRFIIILFLLVLIAVGVYFALSSHALGKHPEAQRVEECLRTKGTLGLWQRKADNRLGFLCEVEVNLYGVKFDDQTKPENCQNENASCFIKSKMKHVDQVLRYLDNSGYEPIDTKAVNLVKTHAPDVFEKLISRGWIPPQ